MENAVVVMVITWWGILIALAVRGAIAIWRSRSNPDHPEPDNVPSTVTAERLAAAIEGDDIEDLTVEERILALATGLKNVKHSVNMVTGRLNKIAPPAEKSKSGNGADVVAPERPRSRADVYREWRSRNAR